MKSLYRLAEDAPLQKTDLRILAAICQAFGLPLGDLISFEKPKAEFRRLDPKTQARLAALMSKNNAGRLTGVEQKEFLSLADAAHRLSTDNARTLLTERQRAGSKVVMSKSARRPKRAAAAA